MNIVTNGYLAVMMEILEWESREQHIMAGDY
jgi:hypothetical protein